jgi:hypothetical protein
MAISSFGKRIGTPTGHDFSMQAWPKSITHIRDRIAFGVVTPATPVKLRIFARKLNPQEAWQCRPS